MIKRMQKVALCGLAVTLLIGTAQTAQAGIIPWTYNAIFGPVGSTFGARRAFRPVVPRYGVGYNQNFFVGNACNTCAPCNTCNYGSAYTVGYAPYATYYGSYNYGCSSCNNCGNCNNCMTGNCATGNCSSFKPATGVTPTPAAEKPTEVPNRTFNSTKPSVNENEVNSGNYDPNDGFEKPSVPAEKPSAPPFGFPGTSNESLKVPTNPMVPVEKRESAPAELEDTRNKPRGPVFRFEPAPVADIDTNVSWQRRSTPTRTARTANFGIPTVARNVQKTESFDAVSPLLPPLPAPVQMVAK